MSSTKGNTLLSTRTMTICAMFIALLSASAYLSFPIPLPGSPKITMLSFVIQLITLLFPVSQALMIILSWMLLGLIGIPVFIGGMSTAGYLFGPWGGYTLSYPIIAILIPLLCGKKYNRALYTIWAILGALLIDFIGMSWLKFSNNLTWGAAFMNGFIAFIPLDMVKSVVAAQIVPAFRKVIPKEYE